jgi:hypothetical protein
MLVDKRLPAVCWLLCCHYAVFECVQMLCDGAHGLPYLLLYFILALLCQLSCKQETDGQRVIIIIMLPIKP